MSENILLWIFTSYESPFLRILDFLGKKGLSVYTSKNYKKDDVLLIANWYVFFVFLWAVNLLLFRGQISQGYKCQGLYTFVLDLFLRVPCQKTFEFLLDEHISYSW